MKARLPSRGIEEYSWQIDAMDLPLLTHEQELDLVARAALGHEEAKQLLVIHNLRFVIYIANYFRNAGNSRLDYADVIQEGNLGLIEAVPHYRVDMSIRFITYAKFHIKKNIFSALRRSHQLIHVPLNIYTALSRWDKTERKITIAIGEVPSPEMVADVLEFGPGLLRQMQDGRRAKQLCQWRDVFNNIPEDCSGLADEFDRKVIESQLCAALKSLDAREAAIITLRFGLGNTSPLTLAQVGAQLSISRERVRQLQVLALMRLTDEMFNLTG